jgi:hypothetical protein
MTDDEADAWFQKFAEYEHASTIQGITTYALRKRGGNPAETVGFVKPTGGEPETQLVRRFLVKWFVHLYGP